MENVLPGLTQLIYASRAIAPVDASLLDIVRVSEVKNVRLEIAGMLFYGPAGFIQLMEGPKQSVGELSDLIQADQRHQVSWFQSVTISKRSIGQSLPMGFAPLPARIGGIPQTADDRVDGLRYELLLAAQRVYPTAAKVEDEAETSCPASSQHIRLSA